MESAFDIAIIGAGIAGLTAGALLAQRGARVILFEAHDKPGGCAGEFSVDSRWGRFTFPVGATVALGLEPHGLHAQVFERLGVCFAASPLDRLRVLLPHLSLDWHHSPQKWRVERQKLPGNRVGQELFWKIQEAVADAGWFALEHRPSLPLQHPADLWRNLALVHPRILPMVTALPFSVGELLRYLNLERDRDFVALVNLALLITVQNPAHAAPLSNGLAGLDLWRHGGWHPKGGMGHLAWKLLEGFEKHGGETRLETLVTGAKHEHGEWHLETTQGPVRAKHIVANMLPSQVSKLVRSPQPRDIRQHAQGWGAVTLYSAIREAAIPSDFPLHAHVLNAYTRTKPYFRPGDGEDVFLSLSAPGDGASAPTGFRTLNVSTHVHLRDWKNLPALEYRERKKQWREKLLKGVRRALPDFDAHRVFVITGTPSTWEHYTHRRAGSVGGIRLNRRNANLRAQSVRTPWPNFYVVGDGTFPGQGTVACALSGWNAVRDITGT